MVPGLQLLVNSVMQNSFSISEDGLHSCSQFSMPSVKVKGQKVWHSTSPDRAYVYECKLITEREALAALYTAMKNPHAHNAMGSNRAVAAVKLAYSLKVS